MRKRVKNPTNIKPNKKDIIENIDKICTPVKYSCLIKTSLTAGLKILSLKNRLNIMALNPKNSIKV